MSNQDPYSSRPTPRPMPPDVNDPRDYPDPNLPPDARFEVGRRSYGGNWGLIAGIVAAILVVAFIWSYVDSRESDTAGLLGTPATTTQPAANGMAKGTPSQETTGQSAQ